MKFTSLLLEERGYIVLESSLSKIKRHAENSFFALSAFRHENSLKENLKRNEELKKAIKNSGLGFIETYGGFKEETPEGKTDVRELSLFVPFKENFGTEEEFFNLALKLTNIFNPPQDSFIFKSKDGKIILYKNNGKIDFEFKGEFHPDKIADIYSELKKGNHRGRKYVLEGVVSPSNSIHAMSLKNDGYIIGEYK